MANNSDTQKSTKDVLADYVKEIIGYDNGLWRTVVDLRKHPEIVLKGYLAKNHKYVSPFRILISSLSLWILVNGFFLDWYSSWRDVMYKLARWIQNIITIPKQNQQKFDHYLSESADFYAKVVGDLFTKYYVPFVLIGLPLAAFLASKKCKKYGIDFKTLLAAMAYSSSLNVLLLFVISVGAYFDILWTFIISVTLIVLLLIIGKKDLLSLVSLRRFFVKDGLEIENRIIKSILISTMLIFFPGMIYFVWYILFVIIK